MKEKSFYAIVNSKGLLSIVYCVRVLLLQCFSFCVMISFTENLGFVLPTRTREFI